MTAKQYQKKIHAILRGGLHQMAPHLSAVYLRYIKNWWCSYDIGYCLLHCLWLAEENGSFISFEEIEHRCATDAIGDSKAFFGTMFNLFAQLHFIADNPEDYRAIIQPMMNRFAIIAKSKKLDWKIVLKETYASLEKA